MDDKGTPIEGSVLKNHFVKIGEGLFSGKIGEKFIGKKNGDEVRVKIEQDTQPINYLVKIIIINVKLRFIIDFICIYYQYLLWQSRSFSN